MDRDRDTDRKRRVLLELATEHDRPTDRQASVWLNRLLCTVSRQTTVSARRELGPMVTDKTYISIADD